MQEFQRIYETFHLACNLPCQSRVRLTKPYQLAKLKGFCVPVKTSYDGHDKGFRVIATEQCVGDKLLMLLIFTLSPRGSQAGDDFMLQPAGSSEWGLYTKFIKSKGVI